MSLLPSSGLGSAHIVITARESNQPIFLGVARANDVDQFFNGIAYDEIQRLDLRPFRIETRRHGGEPFAFPPEDESFWLASATGDNPKLEWTVQEGDFRIVMMNADGSPGTAAEVQFGVDIGGLRGSGVQ